MPAQVVADQGSLDDGIGLHAANVKPEPRRRDPSQVLSAGEIIEDLVQRTGDALLGANDERLSHPGYRARTAEYSLSASPMMLKATIR